MTCVENNAPIMTTDRNRAYNASDTNGKQITDVSEVESPDTSRRLPLYDVYFRLQIIHTQHSTGWMSDSFGEGVRFGDPT